MATVGDRVVTRHNDRRLRTTDGFVRNGALWDVTATAPDGSLTVRPADHPDRPGAAVRLPAGYVREHVELGYATTTARSQGRTVGHHAHRGQRGDGPRRPLRGGDPRPGSQPALRPDRSVRRRLPTRPSPTPGGRRELRTVLATNRIPTTATETWAAKHPGEPVPLPPPVPAWRPEPAVVGRGAERPVTPRRAAPSAMPSSPVPPVHVADRSPSR